MTKANPFPALILFALALLLTGCQSFSTLFLDNSEQVVSPNFPVPPLEAEPVTRHEYPLASQQTLIGEIATINTQANDTFSDLARHFGLGFNDISIANPGVSPWVPSPGSKIVLPTQFILPEAPHNGIVLNLATMRMFFYPKKANRVFTYPVGIGRQGWNTPQGLTSIAVKTANPSWHVPPSIHREHAEKGDTLPAVVQSGPDNPLGLYAMRLAIPSYLIHGTNKPYGIGMQISHGCIQMYPEDIEVLFKKTAVGTPVRIVHQPYLTAWQNDMLYLEAHEPLSKWSQTKAQLKKQVLKKLRDISHKQQVQVDWQKVEQTLNQADGIPTPVLKQSPGISEIIQNAEVFSHPDQLFGQPVVENLQTHDWSILVSTFTNEFEAQELVAMLNHQGPIIPAHKVDKDGTYQVIAGPFKSKNQAKKVVQRLRMDFEIAATTIKPTHLQ